MKAPDKKCCSVGSRVLVRMGTVYLSYAWTNDLVFP
jgi:hypothetical protein